jgi:HTH-type transcriptional regulator, transcriptional repressor of NAD biosynthesis genes
MKNYQNVVVLGKFMPPHKGHEYMMRFARQYGEKLYVIVDCLKEQTLSPELRASWIREEVQAVEVIALKEYTPQDPSEHPDFWNVWKNTIYDALASVGGGKPDLLIAAMDYGWDLAQALECDFVPIDIARESFPISATAIRQNTFENWDFLMDAARPHFMKKICFMGPESTGKSTCAQNIAKHFNTIYVPEYAKAIIEKQNGQFFAHNVEDVAFAQVRTQNALAKFVNRILVCDTDPLTTLLWSKKLFNLEPEQVVNLAQNEHYDMTFLFSPDVPFVPDIHRQLLTNPEEQEQREVFFKEIQQALETLKRPYLIVEGNYAERFDSVKQWLINNYHL